MEAIRTEHPDGSTSVEFIYSDKEYDEIDALNERLGSPFRVVRGQAGRQITFF